MGRIEWLPIDEMPDEIKFGQEVLLWIEGTDKADPFAITAFWDVGGHGWTDNGRGDLFHINPTHWAELNPPGGE